MAVPDTDRSVLVLYGSETGNAWDMAEELGRLCTRLHFANRVDEMDAVDLSSLLEYRFVVFVISTTGQGDMPHNSLLFWRKLLRKRLPPGCLSQLRYTCFGLGDSTYLKFNWAARKLIRRLEQLGANSFFEAYEADEQFPDGVDGAFSNWADRLGKHILEESPLPEGQDPIPDDVLLPPRWSLAPALDRLQDGPGAVVASEHSPPTTGPPLPRTLPVPDGWDATMVGNERLTPDTHWQDVRLVSFDIPRRGPGDLLQCNPGDCLTIYPKNFPEDVDKLITLMGWTHIADRHLDLTTCFPLPRSLFAPEPCTLRNILLENIDITAIPRRSFLRSLSYFAADQDQRERLLEFSRNEFIDEYFDYATRPRRSILEVLDEFHSIRLPADRLLDIFPLIRGRDFSIATGDTSSSHTSAATVNGTGLPAPASSTRVDLLVALVRYRTILRRPRQGLCSRYLAALQPPSILRVSHKSVLSPIHGPSNARRPLVAIATGTGVAPVRHLVHERLSHDLDGPRPNTLLFFGNRSRSADYFFSDEWSDLSSRGLMQVFTAFSRDQESKLYVQHLLQREADRVAELVGQNAIFAVCGGSSKMADACKDAVFEAYRERQQDKEACERVLASLTWWQEIW